MHPHDVHIKSGSEVLEGSLCAWPEAKALVVFAHGSGSSRHSPRNQMVASFLQGKGFATLLFDLLSEEEEQYPENRFNIDLLTQRLLGAAKWLHHQPGVGQLPVAFFGASTGAAAALGAAAQMPTTMAVVSRGGRPDLAMEVLPLVKAPTLLIVGSRDEEVLALNEQAKAALRSSCELAVVEGATHLFEEPGKMQEVCRLAALWLENHLVTAEQE